MKPAPIALGSLVGLVVVAAVVVVVGIPWLLPESFCDLVAALDTAFDAGEDLLAAVKEFLASVTDEMLAGLDGNLRVAAEVLVAAAKAVVSLAVAPVAVITNLIGSALDAAATACSVA